MAAAGSAPPRDVPGSYGLPLVGETVAFTRDPSGFIASRRKTHRGCPMFKTAVLNKSTVVCVTDEAARQVTEGEGEHTFSRAAGYGYLLPAVFGPHVLLSDRPEHRQVELFFGRAFSAGPGGGVRRFRPRVRRSVERRVREKWCKGGNGAVLDDLYTRFKELFMLVLLELFLGVTDEDELKRLADASTKQFKGATSAPVSLRVGSLFKNKFAVGVESHHKLVAASREALSKKWESPDACVAAMAGEEIRKLKAQAAADKQLVGVKRVDDDHETSDTSWCARHLALFVSGLVPKVFAGAATWAVVEAERNKLSDAVREEARRRGTDAAKDEAKQAQDGAATLRYRLMKEVRRMHPPIMGVVRAAKKDTAVCGYSIKKDFKVWVSMADAHRDPKVYDKPDEFLPDRWRAEPREEAPETETEKKKEKEKEKEKEQEKEAKAAAAAAAAAGDEPGFGFGNRACKGIALSNMVWDVVLEVLAEKTDARVMNMDKVEAGGVKDLPVKRPKAKVRLRIKWMK